MFARRILVALLAASLIMLTSCWSRKELNELAMVMALGIDLHKDGYEVSAQVMNSSQVGTQISGTTSSMPVVTYKSVGKTVPEALQRMLSLSPRMLFLSHVRVLVFGEKLARKGVSDVLDYVSRNHQLRTDFYLLVAKNSKASDILEVITPFEHIPANSLFSSILISHHKWAATGEITLQQFIIELDRAGSNPIVSGVQLQGKLAEGESMDNLQTVKPKTLIQHVGIAVFLKDRLVGWLGEPSSKSTNYVLDRVDSTVGYMECPKGGTIGFVISRSKSNLDVKLDQKEKPHFIVDLDIEANLNAVQCDIDLSKPSSIEELRRELQKKYNMEISKNVKAIQQKFGSDIFGFGEVLHRKYPQIWKKVRSSWEEHFRQAEISVNANVAIRRIGSVIQPLRREQEMGRR